MDHVFKFLTENERSGNITNVETAICDQFYKEIPRENGSRLKIASRKCTICKNLAKVEAVISDQFEGISFEKIDYSSRFLTEMNIPSKTDNK